MGQLAAELKGGEVMNGQERMDKEKERRKSKLRGLMTR